MTTDMFEIAMPEYAADDTYIEMLRYILARGRTRPDRTGTGTHGVFGYQARFDLSAGYFPLLTTKAMGDRDWNNIVVELLWMLRGDTNIRWLLENRVHIWTDWPLKHYNATMSGMHAFQPATRAEFEARIINEPDFAAEWGNCGPIYGAQWRRWVTPHDPDTLVHDGHAHTQYGTIDQLQLVLDELRNNPFGRRHVVSAWNPADIPAMVVAGLPPCHCLFQFNVREMTREERHHWVGEVPDEPKDPSLPNTYEDDVAPHWWLDNNGVPKYYLDCQLYQRSCDVFLGVPYNIASYSLLVMIMAQQLGYAPGEFVHTYGDLHIYSTHMDQVNELLTREPYPSPRVTITPRASLDEYQVGDFVLENYQSHPAIRAPVSV